MVTLRLSFGNYVDEPELKLPKIASLCIILAMNVLLQISFFIIVSSSNEYAEYLGGSSTFSGLVIGIPTVFGGLALVPMTKFDKGESLCNSRFHSHPRL